MNISYRKSLIIAFIAVSFLSSAAWALPPQAEADRLMLEAKTFMDSKDYAAAADSQQRPSAPVKPPELISR